MTHAFVAISFNFEAHAPVSFWNISAISWREIWIYHFNIKQGMSVTYSITYVKTMK
jgi:hypothetical protein